MVWTRPLAVLITAGLLSATAACSGGSDAEGSDAAAASEPSAYCAAVEESAALLGRVGTDPTMTTEDFATAINRVEEVQAEAAGDAADAWAGLADSLQEVHDGLADAGLELGDLTKPKKIDNLKPKQKRALRGSIEAHVGLAGAMDTIVADVRDECGVALTEQG